MLGYHSLGHDVEIENSFLDWIKDARSAPYVSKCNETNALCWSKLSSVLFPSPSTAHKPIPRRIWIRVSITRFKEHEHFLLQQWVARPCTQTKHTTSSLARNGPETDNQVYTLHMCHIGEVQTHLRRLRKAEDC